MPDMLIFGLFEGDRVALDVPIGATVGEVKEMFREKFEINMQVVRQDNNILFLWYAGSDLDDSWIFSDLGIVPGTTIRVLIKPDIHPVLFVKCSHNGDTVNIMDEPKIGKLSLSDFRSMVSRKTGLPIGVFRLLSPKNTEMYDPHNLEDYDVKQGDTVNLETWYGWNEFLNLCRMGFSQQALDQITSDEVNGRYQMKVAMFIAAHFGNLDLARCLLKLGIKSDEPIGEHPSRTWCREMSHIETKKAPVHQATLMGQLGVLRLFVNQDITVVLAKDANDLTPLNLALRNRVKNCASFLLTKQWSKINVTKNYAVNITLYTRVKRWAEKAKESAYLKYGQFKSTLKRRVIYDPLVTHGVLLDGFSDSPMTPRSKFTNRELEKKRSYNDTDQEAWAKPQSQMSFARSEKRYTPAKIGSKHEPRHAGQLNRPTISNATSDGAHRVGITESVRRLSLSEEENKEKRGPVKLPALQEKITTVSTSHDISKNDEKGGKIPAKLSTVKHTSVRRAETRNKSQSPVKSPRRERPKPKRMISSYTEASTETLDTEKSQGDDKSDKKKKIVTSAMLISSAKTAEGVIPLPLVSNEKDSRPFFYLNGKREEDFIEPIIDLVSRQKGGTSRERAMASLSIANSFKDKPWLTQVRMAMFLTSRGIKSAVPKSQYKRTERNQKDLRKTKSACDILAR